MSTKTDNLKVNTPAEFLGDPDAAKAFLHQVELYFAIKDSAFKDETAKIAWALSFIRKEPGATWAGRLIDQLTGSKGKTLAMTWAEFKTLFINKFFPTNEAADTCHDLSRLQQGRNSARDYTTAFNNLGEKTELGEVTLIEAFKKCLNQNLKDLIMLREDIPDTLSKWEELVVRFDQNRADNTLKNNRRKGIGRSLYP